MSEENKTVVEEAPVVTEPVVETPAVEETLAEEITKGIDAAEVEAKEELKLLSDTETETGKVPEKKEKEVIEEELPSKESIEEPKKDDAPAVISDGLLERAAIAGMSISDAKSFQNAQALERTISLLEKSKAETVEPKVEIEPKVEKNPFDDIPELDPEVYDEKIVEAFKGIKGIVESQAKELAELKAGSTARQSQDATSVFDASIDALGERFHTVLGKGNIEAVRSNAEAFANRVKLSERINMIQAGYAGIGKTVTRDQVFAEAVRMEFPDVPEVAPNPALKREKQTITPPGRSKASQKLGIDEDIAGRLDAKFGSS